MTKLVDLKAARVTLLNAAKRKDYKWGRLFARYAEIARRKIWWIEIGLLCLILAISGCISNTLDGMRQDINNASRPGQQASWTK